MTEGRKRTVVLFDPHPIWLLAVEGTVSRLGLEIVATATTQSEALARVGEQQPDVLVTEIDTTASEPDGVTFVQSVGEQAPGTRVIVLSSGHTVERIDAVLAAGAAAYVVKTSSREDLAAAVRQAFAQSVFLPVHGVAAPPSLHLVTEPALTPRERELVSLLPTGYSNAELAAILGVSEQTVKFHLSNIYRKIGVRSRTAASRWAHLKGLAAETPPSERRDEESA